MNFLSLRKSLIPTIFSLILISLTSSVAALMNEIDLGGEIDLADEAGFYVTVMSRYFGQDPQQVKLWYDQCPDRDDLAVTLFLSRSTDKSPDFVMALRRQDLGWWEISQGLNVNPNDWFIPASSSLRPPFSGPYGKWTAAGESGGRLELSDSDCRNLIAARFLHQYFEVSLGRAMEMRATGKCLEKLSVEEFLRRQEKSTSDRKEVPSGSAS